MTGAPGTHEPLEMLSGTIAVRSPALGSNLVTHVLDIEKSVTRSPNETQSDQMATGTVR